MILCAALAGVAAAAPMPAAAQLAEARTLYDQAEFEGALAALERAERGDGLSLADAAAVLELRGELHVAMGDLSAVDHDMTQLVTLAPDHTLAEHHPPELHAALARAREARTEPLSVALEATPGEGRLTLDADVRGDPAGIVREVRVEFRRDGGDWQLGDPSTVVSGAGAFDVAVAAIGPGGTVLATDGTRATPRSFVIAAVGGDDPWPWVGLGIGAAVLVVIVVTVAVVVSSPGESDRTQPGLPVIAPLTVRF